MDFEQIRGRPLVVEEKVDGANAGLGFGRKGELLLQSRGHFLTGGPRERHFALLKTWAVRHQAPLLERLGDRYVVYGEWVFAKHTIFYDQLPHYFLEFDVLDRERGVFLSTERRRALLEGLPIVSVRVLFEGLADSLGQLTAQIGPSGYKSARWREALEQVCRARELDLDRVWAQTDGRDTMEGLYVKVEEEGLVTGRYKFIRPSFLTAVLDSGGHWQNRPIVPNQLAPGVDLFRGRS